jgi:ABC-type multidrug transport system fused ATPase/permease subunit
MGSGVGGEGLRFLYSGVRWFKRHFVVSIVVMILGLLVGVFAALTILASVEEIMVARRIPPEPIMIPIAIVYVLSIIPRALYYLGARDASKCFDRLHGYARASLILLLYSVVATPLVLVVVHWLVSEANRVLEATQDWVTVREHVGRVNFIVSALNVVMSIIATLIAIYLVGVFRDIGELLVLTARMKRGEEGKWPVFGGEFATMLRDASSFLTWSYVVSILEAVVRPFSPPLSFALSIVVLVLYIVGVARGIKGLSEIETTIAHHLFHM